MKIATLAVLALLSLTTTSCADEFPPDTIFRGMTIAPSGAVSEEKRLSFSADSGTLAGCKEAVDNLFDVLTEEDEGFIAACVPMNLEELPKGSPTYYMRQFTVKKPFSMQP